MAIKSFKRYEVKYLVTAQQFELIKSELEKHMILDKHCQETGSYMIYNLYFDTEDDAVIRHSIDKPYYKEKLRLRSYIIPVSDEKPVFLELKKKIGGIVAKRRAIIPYSYALEFVRTGIIPKTNNYQDNQVLCEIKEFLTRNKVTPKVFISYERVAYFGKDDSEFRVSFDRNILTRRTQVELSDGDFGVELLENNRYLMEIKCAGQIPIWLCNLMSEMKIYCISFSKYGTEYKNFCLKKNLLNANQTIRNHLYRADNNAESVIINAVSAVKTAI